MESLYFISIQAIILTTLSPSCAFTAVRMHTTFPKLCDYISVDNITLSNPRLLWPASHHFRSPSLFVLHKGCT